MEGPGEAEDQDCGGSNLPKSVIFLGYHAAPREQAWRRQTGVEVRFTGCQRKKELQLEAAVKGVVEGIWVQRF